jgi:hypothetical protein
MFKRSSGADKPDPTPHMPEVDELPNIEEVFEKALKSARGELEVAQGRPERAACDPGHAGAVADVPALPAAQLDA